MTIKELGKYLRRDIKDMPFCPGCGHLVLLNIVLQAIDEMPLNIDEMLFASGIGCAAWIPSPNFIADTLHTLHGRAVAFAIGAKMFNPKLKTVVISGDGDLTSIGGNHLIHAARRNIDMTVICANNMIYGMTGGQVASTSPTGAYTATTMKGNPDRPFDLPRLVFGAGASYAARYAVTQKELLVDAIKKAFSIKGFSFIEALSPCPTQFGRRNDYDSAAKMFKMLKRRCVTQEDAGQLSEDELEDKILTGEFSYGRC